MMDVAMKTPITRRQALQSAAAALIPATIASAQDPAVLRIAGKPVEVSLTSVSPQSVRIRILALDAAGKPQPGVSEGALVKDDWGAPAARVTTLAAPRTVACGNLTVKLNPSPLTLAVAEKNGRAVQELRFDADTGKLSFQGGLAPLLGLGQGGPQFDRRGSAFRDASGQGGYRLATHGARVPIQFVIGTDGWAMFLHQPLGSFDFTAKDATFTASDPQAALPVDLFVIGSLEPAVIMSEYARLTGHAEMAPLWTFGYQQSHRTLGPPEEIMQEAKTFREKKLPCDAMIYLGTEFCPNGWNTRNGEFTWNSKPFPDPPAAIRELHSQHFKVVPHIVVEGHKFLGGVNDACTADPLPPGRTADNHWPPDRQVSCYWPAHKPLLDLGVDGWWPDQGDGYDASSRLGRIRMYFEGQQKYRPNERVYALHRNGYAGMQRYAAFLWSGDVQSTWETLKTHVPVGINAGLSGIPYWGTDIGGFVPTQQFTGELFVRWFQFAAFNPLFRSHGREWRLRLPWGWNRGQIGIPGEARETPSYHPDEAELHNAAVEPICKKYLELRYQLLPYIYSAARETCETGLPMMRALWLHYPDDVASRACGDQYLFGRDLLVAPVVEKAATSRTVYLPHGTWYDFWTHEKSDGGQITRPVDLETIPVYVRAGAIVPMGPVKQYVDDPAEGPLHLWIHPGADGTFSLYEDDGKTFDFRKGEFMKVNYAWNDRQRRLSMRLAAGSKMHAPAKRNLVVHVVGETATRDVVFEGRAMDVKV
jgi:alpha-glucosidase/alpha-D-xyloside xylohydrolase